MPIICGGVIVNPGDLIIADEDGVVSLPRAQAAAFLYAAGQQRPDPYPPASRSKPYSERGFVDALRGMGGVTWR